MKFRIPILLFLLVLVIGVVLAPRVGVSWDESDNIFAGGVYVTFFKEYFNPRAFDGFWDQRSYFSKEIFTQNPTLSHYPPVPAYLGSALTLLSQQFGYGTTGPEIIILFHIATVLFYALFVVTVYYFGLLLGLSKELSVFAALSSYLYPSLFGHGISNIKDTAQVALFTLSLYLLVAKKLYIGAVVWGLALATKFNAIYVPIIWIFSRPGLKKPQGRALFLGLLVCFVAWPYLWYDWHRAIDVVKYFTTVGQGYFIYWNGELLRVGVGKALWWYPFASFIAVTPIPILFLGIMGAVKKPFLLVWFIIPFLRVFLPHSAFYDQVRHFLEVVPAWMLLSAFGLGVVGKYKYIVGAAVLAQLIVINMQLFPYATGYYNIFAREPNTRFDRDIEGLSVYEGLDWLHKNREDVLVWIPIASHTGWNYIAGGKDMVVRDRAMAHYIIVVNKQSHIQNVPDLADFPNLVGFRLIHTIFRGDSTFGWIYERLLK